jgi:peptidoglycan/LPS O-acetylase OafA/YrhL
MVGFPILSVGLGLLVASSLSKGAVLAKFKVPGAKAVALLAYSLYLTHKEAVHLTATLAPTLHETHPWLFLLVSMMVSFAIAWLLYALIERPFLAMRDAPKKAGVEQGMLRDPAI